MISLWCFLRYWTLSSRVLDSSGPFDAIISCIVTLLWVGVDWWLCVLPLKACDFQNTCCPFVWCVLSSCIIKVYVNVFVTNLLLLDICFLEGTHKSPL